MTLLKKLNQCKRKSASRFEKHFSTIYLNDIKRKN